VTGVQTCALPISVGIGGSGVSVPESSQSHRRPFILLAPRSMLSIALTAPRALAARVGDAPFGRALDTADELEREPCVLAIAVVFPLFAHRVASVARTAAWLALLAVVWSLFPFIKADGYWLVCDALGLADLESDPHTPASRRLRWFLRVYRLANVAFLLLVGIGLPLRYAPRISAILDHFFSAWRQPAIMGLLGIVGAAILGWVWFNIARRIVKLVRAAI